MGANHRTDWEPFSLRLASFPSILGDRRIEYKVKEDLWRNRRRGETKIFRIQCAYAALKAVDFLDCLRITEFNLVLKRQR